MIKACEYGTSNTNGTAVLYKNGKNKGNNPDECMYSSQSFGKGDNSEINKEFREKPLIEEKFTSKGRKAMHEHALVIQKYLKSQKRALP